MEKHVHIISSTVPYPAAYGNMVDRFYKLPALAAENVQIHLHCFGKADETHRRLLRSCCATVTVYPHYRTHMGLSLRIPYMVASRKNEQLFDNLLQDDYPIIMEGVHSTALLLDERFSRRRCFVRLQRVQCRYYLSQYRNAMNYLRKMYYYHQAGLLQRYEKKIADKAVFWVGLAADAAWYQAEMNYQRVEVLPLFIPQRQVNSQEGSGSYCLYHGDLSLESNEQAVTWLLKNVFCHVQVPLVIAGKNPSARLQQLVQDAPDTCLVANPSHSELQDIIAKAHIHLLPSFSDTGISGKLLNALFSGRHCIANTPMLCHTGLQELCHVADPAAQWVQLIDWLYRKPFTAKEIALRKRLLQEQYNNSRNAQTIVQWIWGG